MTVFDEHNLMAINDAEGSHPYAQLLAQARLKTAYESNRLNEETLQQFQIMVPDRRWLHALKLGLLTDEEYHDGGRDNDNEVEPNYVISHLLPSTASNEHPLEKEPAEEITNVDKNVALEEQKPIEKFEELYDPKPEVKELDEMAPIVAPDVNELVVMSMLLDTDAEGALEQLQEDAISEEDVRIETETEEEYNIEDEDEIETHHLVENQTDETSEDSEEDVSPFVSWLNSLPAVDWTSSPDGNSARSHNGDSTSSSELDQTQNTIELKADSMHSATKDLTLLQEVTVESTLPSSKKRDSTSSPTDSTSSTSKDEKKKLKKKKLKKLKKLKKKEKKAKEKKEIKRKNKEEKKSKKKGVTGAPTKKKKKSDKEIKSRSDSKSNKQEKRKEKPNKHEALPFHDRIVNSLLLNDTISSETLAQLLTEHGHLRLAQEMYDRLALKYPEKSGYFAAQIQQLNLEE